MECSWTSLWLAALVLVSSLSTTSSYTITVDAHAEECFFENVEVGTKMGKSYDAQHTHYSHKNAMDNNRDFFITFHGLLFLGENLPHGSGKH